MIKFNEIYTTNQEIEMMTDAISKGTLTGDTYYHLKIKEILDKHYKKSHLVHTCTAALEIAALAIDIQVGDEVIMPSYTYVSTANAFALRGAKIVFVDVDEHMMIDINCVKNAISDKTKAIVPVHYAGSLCDMKALKALCKEGIYLIEDAAQSIFNTGVETYSDFSCISLHSTKNITSGGEGGILVVNNSTFDDKVAMIIEKGTNRSAFQNKEVEKYTWKTLGSSYSMDGIRCAFLYAQLLKWEQIISKRQKLVCLYQKQLSAFEIFKQEKHNGHLFYIKTKHKKERDLLKQHLYDNGIESVSHYEPLHLSDAGKVHGDFIGENIHTKDAFRLLRLPVHANLTEEDVYYICEKVKAFYE
ncbi:MAG: dTDP-4-amino-4,6-dideoxygalactose transaminase [Clostridiales bacterium]|nr:dTDP-4-amino-4,6-dideoxygalactose transaminase [Clostridiales bacterium]